MLVKKFIKEHEVNKKRLVSDKVCYLAFFHYKHQNQGAFSKEDIKEWFSALHCSEPNMTRLWSSLKADRRFVKGKDNTYKLHGNEVDRLEEEFLGFDFDETYLKIGTSSGDYINNDRLAELKGVSSSQFDLAKLVRICEELNNSLKTESLIAVGLLVRALIDHVPPLFGCRTFKEVCGNYNGGKSFKKSVENLERSSRNIADRLIHGVIRKKESLPTITQVDFSNDIDVLLEEIVRILK